MLAAKPAGRISILLCVGLTACPLLSEPTQVFGQNRASASDSPRGVNAQAPPYGAGETYVPARATPRPSATSRYLASHQPAASQDRNSQTTSRRRNSRDVQQSVSSTFGSRMLKPPQDGQQPLSATAPTPSNRPVNSSQRQTSQQTEPASYIPPDFGKQTDFRALLSRVLVATVGVLIACCASIWLAKRFLTQSLAKPNEDASLKLLATLPVSRRGCVQLVQADDTRLVVAIDGGAVKSVIPLTESFGKTLFDVAGHSDAETARRKPVKEQAS